jgi:hypothetical protein
MCKHKLRSMIKPKTLTLIAAWEFCFWLLICLWIVTWHRNLDRDQVFKSYVEELGYGTKEQRDAVEEHFNADMNDWDNGQSFIIDKCISLKKNKNVELKVSYRCMGPRGHQLSLCPYSWNLIPWGSQKVTISRCFMDADLLGCRVDQIVGNCAVHQIIWLACLAPVLLVL